MNKKTNEKARKLGKVFGGLFVVIGIVGCVIAVAWVATLVWAWVIPDVFAGAVEQGLLPATLTVVQVLGLWLLFWLIGVRGPYSSLGKRS